jgi:hypothetical protein
MLPEPNLPLGVLRRLPGTLEPDLLSLFDTSIPRQETTLLERGPQILVKPQQRARNSMANGPGLAGNPTADDTHGHIEPLARSGE